MYVCVSSKKITTKKADALQLVVYYLKICWRPMPYSDCAIINAKKKKSENTVLEHV